MRRPLDRSRRPRSREKAAASTSLFHYQAPTLRKGGRRVEMTGGNRALRRPCAVLPLLLLLLPGCQSAPSRRPAGGLDEGPTRWLMLPEEVHQYRRIHSTRETVDFNEAFWRR